MQEKNLEEKIIQGKKNGLPVLLGIILMYVAAIIGVVISGTILEYWSNTLLIKMFFTLVITICFIVIAFGWILFCGLKLLLRQSFLLQCESCLTHEAQSERGCEGNRLCRFRRCFSGSSQ